MTPMPPDAIKTFTAYRRIIGKVQVLLAQQRIELPPLSALALAMIGDTTMLVKEAIRLGYISGSNPYKIVDRLHKAKFVRCSDERGFRLSVELTPSGLKLAADVRNVLAGREVGERVEAAE
jgi:DNA-binding MarR family transcriptional regulator